MSKIVTVIVIIIVVLVASFLIAGFLGPQGFKMERSILINAPRAAVYKNISDYNNWRKWSPWEQLDPSSIYEYYGTQGQVGAGYRWKGNNKVGEGDMHTTAMNENSSLSSQLTFIKPFKSSAMATFTLADAGNNATKVTWGYSQEFPFMIRPMMLVMNMEKMLGPDYEKGLANLKATCEDRQKGSTAGNLKVQEITFVGRAYLANRFTAQMKDIGEAFQKKMPLTYTYLQKEKMQMDGAPSGLYFTWDTVAHTTDMAVAIPVKDASKATGEYRSIKVATSKALMVDFYGPYEKMEAAHNAIKQYIQDKNLKAKTPVIEEYVTDPGTEKDPNKVLTKVYYLIE